MKRRSAKLENLLDVIKKHLKEDTYRFTKHAIERRIEWDISSQDALYMLSIGYHEKRKDSFDEEFQVWKYSIRGRTVDNIDVRVIVKLVEEMLVITVIKVD